MKELKGTMVVMVTPFTEDGRFDEQGFRSNIDWYIAEGIHGLICTGSTSEFANMDIEEIHRCIDVTVDQAGGRVPVMAGTAANTTKKTIELTQYAQHAGADAALIVSPFYGLPNQDELYEHFKAIGENTDISIMIYNNPWYSGVDILPETVAKIAGSPNIKYIKESTGDIRRVHEIQRLCGNDIDVWCGWEDLAYECFLMDCGGWVCPTANLLPAKCAKLFNLAQDGKYKEAKQCYFELLVFLNYLEAGDLLAKVKSGLNLLRHSGGIPRRPFLPLAEKNIAELKCMLVEAGVLST
ncbi:dihydrodipicolinate synthase family protein [Desulforhopalus singaporensis]|uniref:4-hydroxy-tetrahydrodipicolinate synthase n=1 Tax=Desulforhopalus singaporensis TaxID=91360 RepID=A0A1H0VVL9_9BACT|nr:dihydrodipicolinate synthase family protein [Desulforhopalus singaporensis]SDP82597.1 4-hydroxy-tetrahydrodipicolinate synthase [Desulforhopalus singaporensis]